MIILDVDATNDEDGLGELQMATASFKEVDKHFRCRCYCNNEGCRQTLSPSVALPDYFIPYCWLELKKRKYNLTSTAQTIQIIK
ncbi:hypothetical protein DERF_013379 [Dermatophagoides farinae]|uniref:Uncharacterized protein n=1 Tax=Dermatophagoides farinae TaxID=6954 RepID=A0A922KWB1_DERFA|nr:hypothetical protein DERF_013379 [Dermatophagoides farinae]